MPSLIILDRDGVINDHQNDYVRSPAQWHPIQGSLEAIAKLNRANHLVGVATNQSGVARGYYSEATLHAIHDKMKTALQQIGGHVDHIAYCPHHPDDGCGCRKPRPGMLRHLMAHCSPVTDVYMVGDSPCDIEAAQAAGVQPIAVGPKGPSLQQAHPELIHHPTLAQFVDQWLGS